MNRKRGMVLVVLVLFLVGLSSILVEASVYEPVKWVNDEDEDDDSDDCYTIDPYKNNWETGTFCLDDYEYNDEEYSVNICPEGLVVVGSDTGTSDNNAADLVASLHCCPLTGATLTYDNDGEDLGQSSDDDRALDCDSGGKSAYCPGSGNICDLFGPTPWKNWIVWGGDADGPEMESDAKCVTGNNLEHLYCAKARFTDTGFPSGAVYIDNEERRRIDAGEYCDEDEVVCGFKNSASGAEGSGDHMKYLYCCPIAQPSPENDGDNGCNDGGDNDSDELIDCFDEDCDLNDYNFEDNFPRHGKCRAFYDQNTAMCEGSGGDWLEPEEDFVEKENRCCGDDGIDDLGTIKIREGKSFICLNSNSDEASGLVGSKEGIPGCNGWCWVPANDAKFQIFTITKPEHAKSVWDSRSNQYQSVTIPEEVYDVVSNYEDWYECNGTGGEGTKGISETFSPDNVEAANGFYCYQEGNYWSWADCRPGTQNQDNGIKKRDKGDGLFALRTKDKGGGGSTDSTTIIDLDYSSFYGEDYELDIVGYDNLEFMVQFDPDEEKITLPAGVSLTFLIGGNEVTREVLAHATNTPLIEPGKWIHVKAPIEEMLDIEGIKIHSSPSGVNGINVKNVYLSKDDQPLICSGETSETKGESAWFASLDFWGTEEWNAKDMCNEIYDPEGENAWLGGEEVTVDERRCCGNDEGEYYSGDSENSYGCWNSQVVGSGETIMNVKFKIGEEEYTYTCPQGVEECIYPLPRIPVEGITNLHPGLYELWFVSAGEDDVLIDSTKTFYVPGNIKAKKVAQQVIFVSDEEERVFFGCQAASFISDLEVDGEMVVENLNHCEVKEGKFCAYQDNALINSWSDENLLEWGYDTVLSDEMEFTLITEEDPKPAEDRSWPTTVVPGRNFLTNAEFERNLIGWVIEKNGVREEWDDYQNTHEEDGTLTLSSGYTLKSEKITVGKDKNIVFTADTSCTSIINFYDGDGNLVETTPSPITGGVTGELSQELAQYLIGGINYYSGDAQYLILELSTTIGPCEISQPMLQVVDDLGAAEYSYKSDYPKRAGAACCPPDWCWNGYACVMEMSELTYMAEKTEEERFYRCIEGFWKYTPFQWDWNFDLDNRGFCQGEGQCFVLSNLNGGDINHEISDVYEKGDFPTCINNNEYLFDHYCDEGKWTSRTKLLALNLLNNHVDGDYVLYCTNPLDSLVEFGDKEGLLGINTEGVVVSELLEGEGDKSRYQGICFNETFGDLVKSEENTCINNICVLKTEDETLVATSLNEDGAIEALGIPKDKLVTCRNAGLVECDIGNTQGELTYLAEINAVIYNKEEKGWLRGTLDYLGDVFSGLFSAGEAKEIEFVTNAVNSNNLYLLNKGNKKVIAKQELFSENNRTIVAEYENFETPVCDYLDWGRLNLPLGAQDELLELGFGQESLICDTEGETQKVKVFAGIDFFWPQLTGKLRVGE